MANTTIDSICNNPALGDNVEKTVVAAEASLYPGYGVYYHNESGVKAIDGSSSAIKNFAGVLGTKYDHTNNDTVYSDGEDGIPLITEGYVAIHCDDPGAAKYDGAGLNCSGAAQGKFGWQSIEAVTGLGFETKATLIKAIANGDTVCKVKLVK